jgi:hypothetical protein
MVRSLDVSCVNVYERHDETVFQRADVPSCNQQCAAIRCPVGKDGSCQQASQAVSLLTGLNIQMYTCTHVSRAILLQFLLSRCVPLLCLIFRSHSCRTCLQVAE